MTNKELIEDQRYVSIRGRLDKLSIGQLQRIVDAENMCLDEYNYDAAANTFCPIATSFDTEYWLNFIEDPPIPITQESVLNFIKTEGPQLAPGFEFGSVSGLNGQFYTTNREADIKGLAQDLINDKQKSIDVTIAAYKAFWETPYKYNPCDVCNSCGYYYSHPINYCVKCPGKIVKCRLTYREADIKYKKQGPGFLTIHDREFKDFSGIDVKYPSDEHSQIGAYIRKEIKDAIS